MKNFLLSFIFCVISMLSSFSFAQNGDKVIDFYVDTETGHLMSNSHGIDVDHVDGSVANYTITIESLVFSGEYCQCIMRIEANGNHPWDQLFIYRLQSRYSTEHVDVEQHAKEDSVWNAYEISTTHAWFKDTFKKDWIEGNDLCYEVHDLTNNHHLFVVIHNAFGHSVITSITDVNNDSQAIYYNLQGHSSNKPFNGVNIVKKGNRTYKEIH